MTQLFRWINSPPGQHCLAVIHTQYHSICVLLLHLVLQCELHILHPVHLSVMEDPSPFLNTLESIRNSSPANAIRRLHHSRQALVEGVFKISSQAAQRGKCFLQDHPIVAATLSHPDHFKQYSSLLFYNWHQRLQTQIQIQIILNTPFQCKEKCICHSYFSRQINQETSS